MPVVGENAAAETELGTPLQTSETQDKTEHGNCFSGFFLIKKAGKRLKARGRRRSAEVGDDASIKF